MLRASVIKVRYKKGSQNPRTSRFRGEEILNQFKKPVRRLFGVLKKRNPHVKPEDIERVIEGLRLKILYGLNILIKCLARDEKLRRGLGFWPYVPYVLALYELLVS